MPEYVDPGGMRVEAHQVSTMEDAVRVIGWLRAGGYEDAQVYWKPYFDPGTNAGPAKVLARLVLREYTTVYPGDWIIKVPGGTFAMVAREIFASAFRRI